MVIHIVQKPQQKVRSAIIISFCVGCALLVIKFSAFILSGSAAILSDAVESIVNVVSAAFAFYSMKLAETPPDEDHPYGHGKAEFFSAAFEGGAIIVAAIWIIYKAMQELIGGSGIHKLDFGIILLLISTVVNTILGIYLLRRGRSNQSIILEADGKHVLTDVATSLGVVAGLILIYFTNWYFLDSVIAMIVAIGILWTGYHLVKNAASGMMDKACTQDDAIIKRILDESIKGEICGYHKVRHRHSGGMHYVDFHLAFNAGTSLVTAHELATHIESEIARALGDAGVMAHIEPFVDHSCARINT